MPHPLNIRHLKSFEVKFAKDSDNDFIREKNQFFCFNLYGDISLVNKNLEEENFNLNFITEEMTELFIQSQISLISIICDERNKNSFILMKSEAEEQKPYFAQANFYTKKVEFGDLRSKKEDILYGVSQDFATNKNIVILGCICSLHKNDFESIYPMIAAVTFYNGNLDILSFLSFGDIDNSFGLFTVNKINESNDLFICGMNEKILLINFIEVSSVFEKFKIIENENFGIIYNLTLNDDILTGYSDKMESVVKISFEEQYKKEEIIHFGHQIKQLHFDNQFDVSKFVISKDREVCAMATKNTLTWYQIEEAENTLRRIDYKEFKSNFLFNF